MRTAFVFALALSQIVQATLINPLPLAFRSLSSQNLVLRQTNIENVPDACKPDCDPINTRVTEGCSPQQCCTATFVTGYFNCLKCVGGALNATDFTPAQQVLDDLTAQCDARGLNVPKLTLPGINPNRTLPTVTIPPSNAVPPVSSIQSTLPPNLPPTSLSLPPTQVTVTAPNTPLSAVTGQATNTQPATAQPVASQPAQPSGTNGAVPNSSSVQFSHLIILGMLLTDFIRFLL